MLPIVMLAMHRSASASASPSSPIMGLSQCGKSIALPMLPSKPPLPYKHPEQQWLICITSMSSLVKVNTGLLLCIPMY